MATLVKVTSLAYSVEVRLREVNAAIKLVEEERKKQDDKLHALRQERLAWENTLDALGQLEQANLLQVEVR